MITYKGQTLLLHKFLLIHMSNTEAYVTKDGFNTSLKKDFLELGTRACMGEVGLIWRDNDYV